MAPSERCGGVAKNIESRYARNTIASAIGGVGGQILGMLIPLLANGAATPDIGSIVGQVAGGARVLTAIVGAIKPYLAWYFTIA